METQTLIKEEINKEEIKAKRDKILMHVLNQLDAIPQREGRVVLMALIHSLLTISRMVLNDDEYKEIMRVTLERVEEHNERRKRPDTTH